MRRFLLVVLAAFSLLILPLGHAGSLGAAELQPLEIASKSGVHVFAVEMAVDAGGAGEGPDVPAASCRKGRACCSTFTRSSRPASG